MLETSDGLPLLDLGNYFDITPVNHPVSVILINKRMMQKVNLLFVLISALSL